PSPQKVPYRTVGVAKYEDRGEALGPAPRGRRTSGIAREPSGSVEAAGLGADGRWGSVEEAVVTGLERLDQAVSGTGGCGSARVRRRVGRAGVDVGAPAEKALVEVLAVGSPAAGQGDVAVVHHGEVDRWWAGEAAGPRVLGRASHQGAEADHRI